MYKFSEEIESGVYKFKVFNDSGKFVGTETLNANNQQEALITLQNKVQPTDLEIEKKSKIKYIKNKCRNLIELDEYKVFRHRSEKELNITETSISDSEYISIMEKHKSYRDKSNTLESQVNNATDVEEVRNIKW